MRHLERYWAMQTDRPMETYEMELGDWLVLLSLSFGFCIYKLGVLMAISLGCRNTSNDWCGAHSPFLFPTLPELIGISPIPFNSFNFYKCLHITYLSILLWLTSDQCSTDSGLSFLLCHFRHLHFHANNPSRLPSSPDPYLPLPSSSPAVKPSNVLGVGHERESRPLPQRCDSSFFISRLV